MAEEKKSIFRQKSLDRISSPEELDQYLQVTRPSTWLLLAAVVILLVGFITWGYLGRLTTKIPVAVSVQDGKAICLMPDSGVNPVESTMITIGKNSYSLEATGMTKFMIDDQTPSDLKSCGNLSNGDVVIPYAVDGTLMDGFYQGEVVIDQVTPISFIMN